MKKQLGFTLAELLIALALLGIIAVFTIPKVLHATQEQEATAKIKEATSILEQAWYNKRQQNQVRIGTFTLYDQLVDVFNVTNSNTGVVTAVGAPLVNVPNHPCANAPYNQGWVIFPNGTVISGLSNGPQFTSGTPVGVNNYLICIDYNGATAPNWPGNDVFVGNFNQFGDFDGPGGTRYNPTAEGKSFNWGNESATGIVYDPAGNAALTAPFDSAFSRAGYRMIDNQFQN